MATDPGADIYRRRAAAWVFSDEIRAERDQDETDWSFLSRPGEEDVVDELSLFKAELPNGGARLVGIEAGAVIPADDVPVLKDPVERPSISASSSVEVPDDVVSEASQAHILEPTAVFEESAMAPLARKAPKIEEDQSAEEAASPTGKSEMFVVIYVLALDEPFLGQALVDIYSIAA